MTNRQRHAVMILAVVVISLTLLAAPARGDDWFGVHIGSEGFGLSFGSTDWDVWGASWRNPSWSIDYHTALSGYGEWVWVDGLGQCWLPWVTPDWRPFTYGRWVWTGLGWTWVAYEPWGYFPHHFGNWAMAPVGWVWVPGTSYHAANVVWVSTDAWVGWYPSPPPGWSHHNHGHHAGWWPGWNDGSYATFVGWHDLGSDDLSQRALGAEAVRARTPHAVLREGAAAPTRQELSRRGVTIPEMTLERRTARIAGREVMLARPREAAATVERNAGRTVERALAPRAVGTVTRRAAAAQAAAPAGAVPRVAATAVRGGSTARGSRADAGRGGRVEANRTSSSPARPVAAAAPSRPAARTPEFRSSGSPTRSTAIARTPSKADSRGGLPTASGVAIDPARAARSTVSGRVTAPRSPSAAPSASTSRPRSRGDGEAERQAAPAMEKSQGRSQERTRRAEGEREEGKAASRSSARRR